MLRPTRAGWSFFAITFGVGFAALNTGNNLLYLVLSLMLAFLVLSGVLSEASLRGIRVRRRLPRELVAESPCGVRLSIANGLPHVPAMAVVVEDRFRGPDGRSRAAGRGFALRIGPRATEVRSYRMTPPGRGEIEFTEFRVYTRFPFGLFSKSLTIPAGERALVYPALDPLPAEPATDGGNAGDAETASSGRRGSLVGGLRDYAPGDPPRRIHWPATLRRRTLLVREVDAEEQREVEVALATRGVSPGERFERSVRNAASEVAALLATGARVALRTDADRVGPGAGPAQRARLLSFLARVAPGGAG